jgi:3D (Asp-Asp-Asp) domain-containing protein
MRSALVVAAVCCLLVLGACKRSVPGPGPAPPMIGGTEKGAPTDVQTYSATAYSIEGTTKSGAQTRTGIVAADPQVLPLGSRIRVREAGAYDGDYVVHDTGPAIKGREIDIYIPSDAEAKRFGRRTVKVEVLSRGEGK